MEFKHFSHNHGLVFHQLPQGSEIHCSGCKSPGLGNVYVCWQCSYFLHEQCFRAARSLKHPSHPLHPLTLVPFPTYPSGSFFCNSCNHAGYGLSYSCSECEFDIHVHCAHLPNPNSHLSPSPIANPNFSQNFNPQPQNPIYPPPIQTNAFPGYPPPPTNQTDPQNFIPQPQITTYPPNPSNPYPSFPPANTTVQETQNYSTHPYTPQVPQNFVPVPVNDATTSTPPPPPQPTYSTMVNTTINPPQPPPVSQPTPPQFPQTSNPEPKPAPSIIKHFSHPHVLKAMEIEKKNAKVCSACECELSGSAYCCTEPYCTFNLHKSCFDSPREVRHKSHLQHPLTLLTAPPYKDGFTCNACLKDGKAFAYTCSTCSYDLHIDCIQWPDTVTRPDHKHALALYYSSPAAEVSPEATFMCDACKNPVHEMAWVYYCRECDFGTHLECVTSGIKEQEVSGAGAKTEEELLRETELKFAVLQLLLGAQGRKAALELI
ncbi:uncharacterized protein LOC105170022 [Sesamum indicum]|uniref:Uncharacterized protein LOC105170022 n=1 Tax=Sesamum indicum TaxID=4182 RepID=A0A6I9TVB7_SESIN|nr:uncharacterized protein LOC105170022 [Sesamum indicum]